MDPSQQNKEMDAIKRILNPKQTVVALPERYGVEYLILDNEAPSKWVTFTRILEDRSQDSMAQFSCARIVSGIDLYRTTGVPFVVIAAWNDTICALRIWNTDNMQSHWHPHGEPVYVIPAQHFAVRHIRKG